MRPLKIILENEVMCRFEGLSAEHLGYLDKKLAVDSPGARFTIKFKLKQWDGKKHFFNIKTGRTFIRLLDKILPFVVDHGYDINLEDNREERNAVLEGNCPADLFKEFGTELRPYQLRVINALLSAGNGLAESCTGSGKTIMCAALSKMYELAGYRSIVIVPSVDLIGQTHGKYESVGLDVGWYSGERKDIAHKHLITTWQSLQNNKMIIQDYQMVIIDEAHGGCAAVIQEIINETGGHIQFRYGVTGTIPKDPLDRMTLEASIGPVIEEATVTAKELMDLGYLSTLEIFPYQLKLFGDPDLPDYSAEKAYLSKNEDSLEFLAELIKLKAQEHGNTLVLVNSIQFGKKLARLFDEVELLYGETETALRKEQYEKLNNGEGNIVIATSGIASTGIDIPRVHCGIMVFPGKSFTKAIQSVGRMIRKADDKSHAYIYDISASMKYARKHQRERIKYYQEAQYKTHPIQKITL